MKEQPDRLNFTSGPPLLGPEYKLRPRISNRRMGHIAEIAKAATRWTGGWRCHPWPTLTTTAHPASYLVRLRRQTWNNGSLQLANDAQDRCLYRSGGLVSTIRPGRRDKRNDSSNPRFMDKDLCPRRQARLPALQQTSAFSIGFAIPLRDRNPLIYGDHDEMLNGRSPRGCTISENVVETTSNGDRATGPWRSGRLCSADQPHVDVQYGPTGVHSGAVMKCCERSQMTQPERDAIYTCTSETQPQRSGSIGPIRKVVLTFWKKSAFHHPA